MKLNDSQKEKIAKLALDQALGWYTCNLGEDDFPEDPLGWLEEDKYYDPDTGKSIVIYEPYENWDGPSLKAEVESMACAITNVIKQAFKIAEEG